MSHDRPDADRNARMMRRATYAAVAVAGCLIVAKLVAWLYTGSVSVLSTLVDSLLDLAASTVNLMAVRHALTPADHEHRFGHGKAEPLAGLGQSAFIAGSAIFVLFEAGNKFVHPTPIAHGEVGIAVMVISIALTLALVVYQRRVARMTGSLAISADSLHYKGDLLTNVGVMVALLVTMQYGWPIVDPLVGGGVAVFLLYNAAQIVRESLDMLMDRELPDEERDAIKDIALSHPEVTGMHDLRTRASGPTRFVQLHLEMDGAISLTRAHEIADEVEERIMARYPNAEVIIHQDPEGLEEPHVGLGG